MRWYLRAAEAGNAIAMHNIGFMNSEGQSVARDEAEAQRWYRRAAEAGHEGSRMLLDGPRLD